MAKEARSIKDLLQVMLDNQDLFETGLCLWNTRLWKEGLITTREYLLLHIYFRQNTPAHYYDLEDCYWWDGGFIEPRIEWINEHLNL